MANSSRVVEVQRRADEAKEIADRLGRRFADGGGPPDNGAMEARVSKLEAAVTDIREKMAAVDSRLAVIDHRLEGMATKADLHKEINAQTWKLVTFVCGFGTALVAATYFVATHIK